MIKVLLVEDEELILQGLKLTTPWESMDCRVIGEAMDGEAGMEQIMKLHPDIVITDIRMPKMSGLEMIDRLREQISCEYIILSGYDDFSYAQKALNMGVRGYLLKPVDDGELKEILTATVKTVLEKRAAYQSLSEKLESAGREEALNFVDLKDRYLERALEIIRDRYQENLTLKSVADELRISESYLGKLFKGKMSYTFLDMLTLYRIKGAAALLSQTDMKVYEVAYAIGYSDARYFSKVFRKIAGLKPMEVRNGHPIAKNNILNHLS